MVKSFPSVIILFNTFFIRIILASPSSAEEYEVKNKMQKIRLRKTCIFLVYPMKLVIQFHVVQCHGLSFQLMSSIRVNSVHGTFLQQLARLVLSQKRAKKRVPIKILHWYCNKLHISYQRWPTITNLTISLKCTYTGSEEKSSLLGFWFCPKQIIDKQRVESSIFIIHHNHIIYSQTLSKFSCRNACDIDSWYEKQFLESLDSSRILHFYGPGVKWNFWPLQNF